MSKGGSGRDWGYASYDMDNPDSDNLIYTSYEKSKSVNQYPENDDGGHGHYHWNDKNDHDLGRDSNSGRSESNSSGNPTTGEVQNNGGCYLTSACMQHFAQQFNDKCYELQLLRWFRDNFVSEEDIAHYYETAPLIVNEIDLLPNSNEIYDKIYYHVIAVCVKAIEKSEYAVAYQRYKESILQLEEAYVRPALEQRLIRALQPHNA
ncbi:TPA: hypothetical protein IAB95_04930 [Candidatus Ventrenecus avicola]|nr:hypothetical protein [Candidatus Ventrenecus avicola]